MPYSITSHLSIIVVCLVVLELVTLIIALTAMSTSASLKKKLRRWKAIHDSTDLEHVYDQTLEAVASIKSKTNEIERQLDALGQRMAKKVDTPMIRRYNAFSEVGNDLSYSVALLDEHQNGVVLTSIYGRNDSNTYGKPVQNGQSDYALTEEEKEAIQEVHTPERQKRTRQLVR